MINKYALLLFIFPYFLLAQFQRDFVPAEIKFQNGESLEGWIYDEFATPKPKKADHRGSGNVSGNSTFEIGSRNAAFPTVLKKILFKENYEDGQQQSFDSETIDYIITKAPHSDEIKYKTLKFIRTGFEDDKITLKMDTVQRSIWAPVIHEGSLNMYGYFTMSEYKKGSWSEVYFQKEKEEYAYQIFLPYKIGYSSDTHKKLIRMGMKAAFNDCPYFEQNLEFILENFVEDLNKSFASLSSEDKNKIKSYPKDERPWVEYEIFESRSYIPYQNLYDLYLKQCRK
jgi:hypothetical protein